MIVNPQNPDQLISMLKAYPLVLYGMGGAGVRIGKWCNENQIQYIFADQNALELQNNLNIKVVLPELLRTLYPEVNIVITSILYYDEIFKKLLSLGFDKKYILSYSLFFAKNITWKDLEDTTTWGEHVGRMQTISKMIPSNARSVVDYGEGKLSLKKFLNPTIKYYPIDYTMRSEDTILCDFDKDNFPNLQVDVSVCTATLIFLKRANLLLKHICKNTFCTIILSYIPFDIFSNSDGRRASGYLNDFTEDEIIKIFLHYGFVLVEKKPDPANKIDILYMFTK